jgi:hypothetical protein
MTITTHAPSNVAVVRYLKTKRLALQANNNQSFSKTKNKPQQESQRVMPRVSHSQVEIISQPNRTGKEKKVQRRGHHKDLKSTKRK